MGGVKFRVAQSRSLILSYAQLNGKGPTEGHSRSQSFSFFSGKVTLSYMITCLPAAQQDLVNTL